MGPAQAARAPFLPHLTFPVAIPPTLALVSPPAEGFALLCPGPGPVPHSSCLRPPRLPSPFVGPVPPTPTAPLSHSVRPADSELGPGAPGAPAVRGPTRRHLQRRQQEEAGDGGGAGGGPGGGLSGEWGRGRGRGGAWGEAGARLTARRLHPPRTSRPLAWTPAPGAFSGTASWPSCERAAPWCLRHTGGGRRLLGGRWARARREAAEHGDTGDRAALTCGRRTPALGTEGSGLGGSVRACGVRVPGLAAQELTALGSRQHGGVRGSLHAPGHHGERAVPLSGQRAAPQEQVRAGPEEPPDAGPLKPDWLWRKGRRGPWTVGQT